MRLRTADQRRVEHALNQLESRAAPRVSTRLQLDAPPPAPQPGQQARRAATLDQIAHQLLFGLPASTGPFPSQAMHDECASLFRHKHLNTPAFGAIEQLLAAMPGAGAQVFGTDWRFVAFPLFNVGKRVAQRRAPLEAMDYEAWRRARWAAFLASPEGVDVVGRGLVQPAASDVAAMASAEGAG